MDRGLHICRLFGSLPTLALGRRWLLIDSSAIDGVVMNIHQVMAISLGLILAASGANAADEPTSDSLIPVTISGEKLGDVLEQLSSLYGYNFIVHPEIRMDSRGPQSYVAPIPAAHALRMVAAAYGACANVRDTIVGIRPCDDGAHSRRASTVDPPKVALGVVVEEKGAECPTNGVVRVTVTEFFDEQGAGHKAGIRLGDVILSYDGASISSGAQLKSLVGNTQPGESVPVVVLRGAERLSFNVQF